MEWIYKSLPDCRVSIKESEKEDDSSWMHWQHARQLTFSTMVSPATDDHVTRQATSDRQQDIHWFQVRTWHDHSYIAGIPLLVHGLTVKLSPCQCSHSSTVRWIAACLCVHPKCNLLLALARLRMIQHLSSFVNFRSFTKTHEQR